MNVGIINTARLFVICCALAYAGCSGTQSPSNDAIPDVPLPPETPIELSCSSVEGAVLVNESSTIPQPCVADSWLAGSDEICQGRHIYRDYVYDDFGADLGQPASGISGPAGDQNYPSGEENTADFVNLQLWINEDRLHIRAELNTLFSTDSTTLAIAIDTDNNLTTGGGVWCDIEISSQGWDVLQAFRTGNTEHNVIEGHIPLPEGNTWNVQAVLAQADGTVMNAAYRGIDERARCVQASTASDSTAGCFFEDNQSVALADGDITLFSALINPADLSNLVTRAPTPITPGFHSRVYTSEFTLGPGEGIGAIAGRGDGGDFPAAAQQFVYLGKYQPYALYLPTAGTAPYPLQMVWHGTGAVHGSQIDQLGMQQAFGEQFGRILVSPLARGPDGYGSDISERDLLDVMDDVEGNFDIDLDRVISSGYSQGGYISYRMAALYPQRFAGFVSWVGFTGDDFNGQSSDSGLSATAGAVGNIIDFVGNLRHIPGSMLYAGADELVQFPSAQAMQEAFDATDNIYRWYMHPGADHLALILLDEWDKEATDSANYQRVSNPARVSFRHDPTIASPEYGISHNRAYWISEITNRNVGADHLEQVYADIDLTNYACGGSTPISENTATAGPSPVPWYSNQRNQIGAAPVAAQNLLEGSLSNIQSINVDVDQTCNTGQTIQYSITTDGPAEINFSDGRSLSFAEAGVFDGSI